MVQEQFLPARVGGELSHLLPHIQQDVLCLWGQVRVGVLSNVDNFKVLTAPSAGQAKIVEQASGQLRTRILVCEFRIQDVQTSNLHEATNPD